MRLPVAVLPPEAEQPLLLQQSMDKIPISLTLAAVRTRGQWLQQSEFELSSGLRMHIEYVRDDGVDALVLPVPHIATELEEMHP
ncbi:hypothetical protein BGV66_00945 [Burkholderia ubonensis]|uniref:LysR substrate-binding domain-containing protein n=1 Tax=Burkholderia ubonensis TaxID=101571 RepID=A0ABD6QAP5_9BURK|nr:hypothetical protein BGV66_00945 [Burkholderia ubonensis]